MVPQSGRVNGSAVELMSKMLQVFTLSYPDSAKEAPKVMVLFTNFSATETYDDSGDISFDEDDEETLEESNSSGNSVSFSSLIDKFREDLVAKF